MNNKRIFVISLIILVSMIVLGACIKSTKPNANDYNEDLAITELALAKVKLDAYFQKYLAQDDLTITKELEELVDTYQAISDALSILRVGNLTESCASRCHHECSDPAGKFWCTMNCSTPDCHPACCGCPGTYIDGSCDGCKAPSDVCD